MSRRGNGEGAIYFNKRRQRWEGQLDLGRNDEGRRVRRKLTGRTKSEVAKKMHSIRQSEMHVRPALQVQTLGDLLDLWIETAAASRLGEGSTLAGYRHHAKSIADKLGRIRLDRLGPDDVERYLLSKAKAGYSKATLVRHRSILSQSVKWGVGRRYIGWDVVAVAEMPPKAVFDAAPPRVKNRRTARSLDSDELRQFVEAAQTRRNGVALIVAATVGLRPGELTALLWEDVDLETGVVQVRRAWKGSGDTRSLGETKTSGSVRAVNLPSTVVGYVRSHRADQLKERMAAANWDPSDPGLVFTTTTGSPIDPANLRRLVREVASDAGVGHLTPYDLRHTATSVLSAAGVRNEHLADLLGHVDTRMVQRHYRHLLGSSVVVAAGPMDELLGGA